jgi:carbohydrate-selective porin OprB
VLTRRAVLDVLRGPPLSGSAEARNPPRRRTHRAPARKVPKSRAAAVAILGAVFAATGYAEAASSGTPEVGSLPCGHSKLPGEYPERRFRSSLPSPVAEQTEDFEDKYLLGDWLGVRPQLAHRGVRLTLLFITDPFGDVTGGKRGGFSDYNLVGGDLLVDTDKLLGWCGGELHVGFAANFGTSLSKDYVGNVFPVQLADVADTYARLTYLSYTQSLFDDALSIRVGRLTINSVYGDEFLASEYFKTFTSVGIDLVPIGLFLNAPGAFGYPDTTWGARVKVEPVEEFYAMIGTYNGDPNLKEGELHGVDFSMRGPLFLIGEIGLRRNYGKDADGLSALNRPRTRLLRSTNVFKRPRNGSSFIARRPSVKSICAVVPISRQPRMSASASRTRSSVNASCEYPLIPACG